MARKTEGNIKYQKEKCKMTGTVIFHIEALRSGVYTYNMAAKKKKAQPASSDCQQTDQIHAAIDYGIDISMLIQNIGRSYTERIIRHQIALNTAEKLRKARHL